MAANKDIESLSPGEYEVNERRRKAHTLLIELLACQFAFPVKWIDTQESLLRSLQRKPTRFVEFGPSNILSNLARRSFLLNFPNKDIASVIHPDYKFLSSAQHDADLRYGYDPNGAGEILQYDSPNAQAQLAVIPAAIPASKPPIKHTVDNSALELPSSAPAAGYVPDIPVPVEDVARCLIAYRLKENFQKISPTKSIKELSRGRSTLQNEILGDLAVEFGHLPNGAEDLALNALSESLQNSVSSDLGKQSNNLIARFISSKMPLGFNSAALGEHLKQKWGLGYARQNAVLMLAITSEPSARFPTTDAAKEYFDSLVLSYAALKTLAIRPLEAQSPAQHLATVVVDSGQVNQILNDTRSLSQKQYNLLGNHLGVNATVDSKLQEVESAHRDALTKLDLWRTEFSEEFEIGIQPSFNAKLARRYSSSWNLAREDIIKLYHDSKSGRLANHNEKLPELLLQISNRMDGALRELLVSLQVQSLTQNTFEEGLEKFSQIIQPCIDLTSSQMPVFKFLSPALAPQTNISPSGDLQYSEIQRTRDGQTLTYGDVLRTSRSSDRDQESIPHIHIRRKVATEWKFDSKYTETLLWSIDSGTSTGFCFANKNVLVTGASRGSIGTEVVKGLLMGGARVIMTTSRAPSTSAKFCQELYANSGARGSELILVQFNQGSVQDCEALVDYIYADSGLGRTLDIIVPFAAISEKGREIDDLGAKSELTHRLMMANVLRLLGRIIHWKRDQRIDTRPTQVILPLSSNHGIFGSDGLYSESKLGLESLFNRFNSENWSDYLLICGAVIGWTRGTGLMDSNDIVSEAVETYGAITFSTKEMAFNILSLMTPPMVAMCECEPMWADLNGGLQRLPNLREIITTARSAIMETIMQNKAIKKEDDIEEALLIPHNSIVSSSSMLDGNRSRSTIQIMFPRLPDYSQEILPLGALDDMVETTRTIVVVGYSELGPWGSSRTRWEMESQGTFSQQGFIEMAWLMNLIKHFDGQEKGGGHYVGWVDAETGAHVHDDEVEDKYGERILEHSGIRIVEPGIPGGYDANAKEYLHEVVVEEDLPEFDGTSATAEAFKLKHGNNVTIRRSGTSDEYKIQVKRGATIMLPKAVAFDSIVAGQIPSGFNPATYGVPEDIISQVDPITIYALCCVSEALYSAGITDAFEVYKHLHISELGIFLGSSMGGAAKTVQMYKDRYLDKSLQGDLIQETYANTVSAWVNMLILGGAGAIKTPIGACATGVESLDSACESILVGKTKMAIVGGADDLIEDDAFSFRTMKATVNAREELRNGRLPGEMSRPTAESRAGFVESHGCGVQIITTAEVALEMGLPIYGIVASTAMAADRIGRSVPAPGQGILSFARETPEAATSPLLDINYRRAQIQTFASHDDLEFPGFSWIDSLTPPYSISSGESTCPSSSPQTPPIFQPSDRKLLESHEAAIKALYRNDIRKLEPNISPLKASLAVWGLNIDEVDMVSMHGTSTQANEKNEAEVIHKQMTYLGRKPDWPLPVICQKSVTGHPKSPAATWMLNGCLQSMDSCMIPGNRNADTVDENLRQFNHLFFPTRSMKVTEIRSFLLNSFGFGQKGGQVVGVAPKYLFATLKKHAFDAYVTKVSKRTKMANRAYIKAMLTNSIVKFKSSPPYDESDQSRIYLDPLARISERKDKTFYFDSSNHPPQVELPQRATKHQGTPMVASKPSASAKTIKRQIEQEISHNFTTFTTIGIGINEDSSLDSTNNVFIDQNFTAIEKADTLCFADAHASYVGRWCAKEAVFKSLRVPPASAGVMMQDIEIISEEGSLGVKLYGEVSKIATERDIQRFDLSISQEGKTTKAVALAFYGREE